MTNIDRATEIISRTMLAPSFRAPESRPLTVADALAKEGLLAPEPRVIRTAEELATLDPDTVLINIDTPQCELRMNAHEWMEDYAIDAEGVFPLAVIATGDEVRAARQSLEEV